MRISDWSSDVCSSDLFGRRAGKKQEGRNVGHIDDHAVHRDSPGDRRADAADEDGAATGQAARPAIAIADGDRRPPAVTRRDEVMAITDPRAGRTPDNLSNPRR